MTDAVSKNPLPALRQSLEAIEFTHEGHPMILIRDQEGLTNQTMAVSIGAFLVATLLNGRHSVEDIQSIFTKSSGTVLSAAEIQNLVAQLEKADLLETPRITEKRDQVRREFLKSPIRKPMFQGVGYPSQPLDVAVQLGGYFRDPQGPQKEIAATPQSGASAVGLISPHIDLARGGPAYAWAYQALSETPPPDAIISLGVAHTAPPSPWISTQKSYETPYGAIPVHADLYREFKKCLWYDPAVDEAVHRTEHSLEFQALWLKYLWKEKTPAWLPILTSSFYAFASDRAPSSIPTIEGAIQSFGDVLRSRVKRGERILILMGVDLAHVGARFGDDLDLTPELRTKIEAEDRASLNLALEFKADEFYMSLVKGRDWRKVCGHSALYTGLRWIRQMSEGTRPSGRLLTYGQADDPLGGVVSFASAIFDTLVP